MGRGAAGMGVLGCFYARLMRLRLSRVDAAVSWCFLPSVMGMTCCVRLYGWVFSGLE